MRVGAAVVCVGLLCASGCATAGAQGVGRVSFRPAAQTQLTASEQGVLGGDPGTGCLWFERYGERVALVVEHDSAHLDVTADPAVVRDGDDVWAVFGEQVQLGGGHVDLARAVPECRSDGAPFVASSLRRASS